MDLNVTTLSEEMNEQCVPSLCPPGQSWLVGLSAERDSIVVRRSLELTFQVTALSLGGTTAMSLST